MTSIDRAACGTRAARLCRRAAALAGGAAVAVVACLAAATPASADYGLAAFTASLSDADAGARADFTTRLDFEAPPHPIFGVPWPEENIRTVQVELPAGLLGNAGQLPTCGRRTFEDWSASGGCPDATQVGVITTRTPGGDIVDGIYNIEPGGGDPAMLGFRFGGITPIHITIEVRNGSDYGLTATAAGIPSLLPISGVEMTFWGVPARHNGSGAPEVPFMTNPTDCSQEPKITARIRSYEQDVWHTATQTLPTPANCDQIDYRPGITVTPENPVADKPSGVQVGLQIPQNEDPDGQSSPALRDITVRMPEGVTINPSVAHDRTACSDGAFGIGNGGRAACPPGSKIGTIGVAVPALRQPLPGDIYLGEPKPGQPFRIFLYTDSQGVRLKLEGAINPDHKTGQIIATFRNNPQVPFSAFNLRFLGGERSVLLMPPRCGVGTVLGIFTPYSSSASTAVTNRMQIMEGPEGVGCAEDQPFGPSFEAGTTGATAGADTGFIVRFGRPDGHESLSKLKLELPAGLLGRLAAFPLCPNAQANAGTCSEDSMVGGTTVSAGTGGSPLNLAGRVFLTEPPKPGQIAGLSIVVPAVVGPYNLGTPVVRAGITVNPDTSLTIESDPLPTMLEGVQLRIKQVIVSVDRPGFMFNPTDCSPKLIRGSITSTDGTEVGVASPFSVRGCANMPLEGKVAISTTAPARDGGNTGLTFNLGGLPGHSNVRQVQVVLPSGMGARLDGPLQTPCTEADFASDKCMESSRVGVARATTPVLPEPLAGNVYFIENPGGNALPRLGIRLKGAISLDVIGNVEVTRSGRVATTFPAIPDVPISDFVLNLDEGENAVLSAAGLCGKTNYANVDVIGHTGKQVFERVAVQVDGCRANAASKSKARKKAGKSKKKGANHRRS